MARDEGQQYFTTVDDMTLFCNAVSYGVYEIWNKTSKEGIVLGFRELPKERNYTIDEKKVGVSVVYDGGIYITVQFTREISQENVSEKANQVVDWMQRKYNSQMFLKNYFDNLYVIGAVKVIGAQANVFRKVYLEACKVYPDFGEKTFAERMQIMSNAQKRLCCITKDSNVYARIVFEEINLQGLDSRLYKFEPYSKKRTLYTKCFENRKKCNCADTGKCKAKDRLIFAMYEYYADDKTKWRKCFAAQELWKLLIRDYDLTDKLI